MYTWPPACPNPCLPDLYSSHLVLTWSVFTYFCAYLIPWLPEPSLLNPYSIPNWPKPLLGWVAPNPSCPWILFSYLQAQPYLFLHYLKQDHTWLQVQGWCCVLIPSEHDTWTYQCIELCLVRISALSAVQMLLPEQTGGQWLCLFSLTSQDWTPASLKVMVLSQTSPGDYYWFWLVGGGISPSRSAEWVREPVLCYVTPDTWKG